MADTCEPMMSDTSEAAEPDINEPPSPTAELHLDNLPTEIFFILFEFVPPKDMVRCRQVCVRWKEVIDAILSENSIWEKFCRRDYKKVYKQAMWKTPNITNWFEMYRSLSLWTQLGKAQETIEEFCRTETIDEEMRSAIVQERGVVMIHKRTRVVYHDLVTLEVATRKGSAGQYSNLVELKDVVIMIGMNSQLHIVNKRNHDWHSDLIINREDDDEIVFEQAKLFLVGDRTLYFATYHYDLYAFHLDNDKVASLIELPEQLMPDIPGGLAAIGFSDGCLHILTMSRNMYLYINKRIFLKLTLDVNSNLMDCLYKYDMLENLEWRHYYVMQTNLKHKGHKGLLRYICKMQIYGNDLFFVGSQCGIVSLYFRPIKNGELDLEAFQPCKVYNFTARIEIPILSVYPILNIEVTETKDGHIILVCMPRKILVITYKYNFETPAYKLVLPDTMPELTV